MTVTQASPKPPRNGQLPFWVSPWRYADRTIGDATVPHHICTVARSRSDRHHGIEIEIPSPLLAALKPVDRQKLFANRLVDALKTLGMVAEGEDQRTFK